MDDPRPAPTPDERAELKRRVQADSERAVKRYALPEDHSEAADFREADGLVSPLTQEEFQATVLGELREIKVLLARLLQPPRD